MFLFLLSTSYKRHLSTKQTNNNKKTSEIPTKRQCPKLPKGHPIGRQGVDSVPCKQAAPEVAMGLFTRSNKQQNP